MTISISPTHPGRRTNLGTPLAAVVAALAIALVVIQFTGSGNPATTQSGTSLGDTVIAPEVNRLSQLGPDAGYAPFESTRPIEATRGPDAGFAPSVDSLSINPPAYATQGPDFGLAPSVVSEPATAPAYSTRGPDADVAPRIESQQLPVHASFGPDADVKPGR